MRQSSKVMQQMEGASSAYESEPCEKEEEQPNEFVTLTDVVRQHYVRYLERQLEENVRAWAEQSRNHHKATAWASIGQSVEALEGRAIKACMAAQVYQRIMVKMIAAVRRNTKECRLADALFDCIQLQSPSAEEQQQQPASKQCFIDNCTQTVGVANGEGGNNVDSDEDVNQQKIDLFHTESSPLSVTSQRRRRRRKRKSSNPVNGLDLNSSPISTNENEENENDVVAQQLALLFTDDCSDLNNIFGIEPTAANDDPQFCAILTEIEQSELPSSTVVLSPAPPPPPDTQVDLRHSLWPCELYAQRRQLNSCLVRLLDADWRCERRLRYKFHVLFGEDSDDEFSTSILSPSIELVDEELLASCILRIRPWIVQQLMRPLQEGLIANRFLFKKLAKMLAHSIVLANPYATERQVEQAVENLFCVKATGVQSACDLMELPNVATSVGGIE